MFLDGKGGRKGVLVFSDIVRPNMGEESSQAIPTLIQGVFQHPPPVKPKYKVY